MSNKRTNPEFLNGVPELLVLRLAQNCWRVGFSWHVAAL